MFYNANNSKQQYVAVSDLKIPEYYSKKELRGKMETIRKSIQSFGVKSPLVVNENPSRENFIVQGVSVFRIAKELGVEEVPVMYVDLDLNEEKQLRVLLDQKGSLELSQEEIIKLLGQLDYEAFFPSSVRSDTLSKHFEEAQKEVASKPPSTKKAIKQLLIRLPLEDDATLKATMREMGTRTLAETITVLLEIYKNWKDDIQKSK